MMPSTRQEAISMSAKRYFTGVPCVHGHSSPRRTQTGECLECRAEYLVAWRKKNPEKVKQHNDTQHLKFAEKLADRARFYYYKDVEKSRKNQRDYQKRNIYIFAKIGAKYKASKLKRTPVWLTDDDHWMIEQAYELAQMRTLATGFAWHVDHIYPLQGKTVSGLHTPYNLQVIPAVQNLRKGNRV